MKKNVNQISNVEAMEMPSSISHHDEHELPWIRRYIFSLDHKVIGKQFMFSALFFLVLGGLAALMVRWQLAWPNISDPSYISLPGASLIGAPHFSEVTLDSGVQYIMDSAFYNQLFTMHATFMIFFAIIPLLVGLFGNFLIPLQVGYKDMAFPILNGLSMWLMWPAGIIMISTFFMDGGPASSGWTAYPTLSEVNIDAQTAWIVSLIFVGVSSIMGAVNYITTVLNCRAPGMTMFRLPLTTWSLFITSVLTIIGLPVLTAAFVMLLIDRTLGTGFFLPEMMHIAGKAVQFNVPGQAGQPLLWQHLFWFYSHPAVYIMVLPAMGIVSDLLSVFSRKPIFGYKAMIFSLLGISFMGTLVWGHHMFQSGMNPYLGTAFSLSTSLIAVPSAIKIFNWMGTIWGGQIRYTTAMLFALSFVGMFMIGGLSGIFMASTAVDIFIHDTYFIVAHIHYVLFASSLMAIFGGIYYWFPKMFGRFMNEGWGKVHFWSTFIFLNCTFFPMHILGIGGMMRRIYDPTVYAHLQHFQPINKFITISALLLGTAQIPFLVNVFYSMWKGKVASKNPWEANTLEWSADSPPPHHNFAHTPTVYRGAYEYSVPDMTEDYLPQDKKA